MTPAENASSLSGSWEDVTWEEVCRIQAARIAELEAEAQALRSRVEALETALREIEKREARLMRICGL